VKIGLIVNPIAGMGGSVALKGTDGGAILAEARRRGAEALAPVRARRALARLALLSTNGAPVEILTPPGIMGGDAARAAGLDIEPLAGRWPAETTAEHTRRAAAALRERRAALILKDDDTPAERGRHER